MSEEYVAHEEVIDKLKKIGEELEDLRKEICFQMTALLRAVRRAALLHAAILLALLLLLLLR
jgi:hypothetical protein